jgi:tRNA pseudouridine55 synthase
VTSGILLVDKPEGVSSAGVIRALKGALAGTKVGHLGTLDPFASGLLPLCLGEATKVARYLLLEEKAYTGTIQLGVETDTLDATGSVTARADVPALDPAELARVAAAFRGPLEQVPPMYSALKRDGVPLYKLARQGVSVERAPRAIVVHELALAALAPDRLSLEVRCSKGTYVRVLAVDLARALGTLGHLTRLRRTAVGVFRVEDAWSIDRLRAEDPAHWPVVSIRQALGGLPAFALPADALERLWRGQQRALAALPQGRPGDVAVLTSRETDDVAAVIETVDAGPWRLVRMLHGPPLQG